MKLPRPKSMLGLLLVGFLFVAFPPLVAVVRGVVFVDRLASQSERLVLQGVQVTRESGLLREQVGDMARYAHQYLVLNDPAVLKLYDEQQARFVATLGALKRLTRNNEMATELEHMRTDSEIVIAALRSYPPDSPEVTEVLEQFAHLGERATGIAERSYQDLDSGLESVQDTATNARRILIWQSTALLLGTLALVLVFAFLIARPVRQMGRAVRLLGEGEFTRPIAISGPPELEALGRELDWLRQRLIELEEEKNKFLSHMSHELKTPLASIREGTELLMDGTTGALNGTQREVGAILRQSSIELQRLIVHLLDIAAWQEKQERLDLGTFELGALIGSIVEQHKLAILGKKLTVNVDSKTVEVRADREKMRTAFDNLISNAVKFSPEGGTIQITLAKNGYEVTVDISDTGPGIPEAERSRVFEPFFQGNAPQRGPVRGTGIGLSVVRECIQAHRGKIHIVEENLPGAHFRIALPVDLATEGA